MNRCRDLLQKEWPQIKFSNLYRTAPQLVEEQDSFLNACGRFETEQSVYDVQAVLQGIEVALGKQVAFRYGPRSIDLDLLLYDNTILNEAELVIPHPKMQERRFVLEPLCELLNAKDLHPVLQTSWEQLLAECKDQVCERLRNT